MILLTFNIINHKSQFRKGFSMTEEEITEITGKNISSILEALENHNIFSTFFVEISLCDKLQTLIKKIVSRGHEVSFYNEKSTLTEINDAKAKTELLLNKNIRGIRQKEILIHPDELKKLEFSYISNIENADILFPFKRLKRSTEILEQNGMSIVPESISPYSQIPYNDFVFQVLPMTYYENMVFETIKNDDFVLIYLNSWQFTDLSELGFKIPFYRRFNSGIKMRDKLDSFLTWINENELATSRMKDYIF